MQKVILQEDIEKLGHRGDVVTVKPGYARNFLLPHKLAIEATTGNMKALERIRTSLAKKTATEMDAAQKQAAALNGVPATFVFFRITLPMLAPYIITASLFRLLDSIQQFDIIYAMTQGGPGDRLMVFQVQAYLEFFQYTNVGKSAALLMILWVITNILSNIFIKNWLRLREHAHRHQ